MMELAHLFVHVAYTAAVRLEVPEHHHRIRAQTACQQHLQVACTQFRAHQRYVLPVCAQRWLNRHTAF
jgi:hypothetical protein